MQRALGALVAFVVISVWASPAVADPFTIAPSVSISISTPFAPGCGGDTEGSVPGSNFNYPNSETEPWIAVSPTNPNDVAAFWQQDQWSDGGAHGLVASVSHNGGGTFAHSWPHFSRCAGGTDTNGGDFGRSSDPWMSWAPNGDLWAISLSIDRTTPRNAILAARMPHGTSTWSEPFTLKLDSPLGNAFNDKESLTADPTDASGNLVYSVWDRFVSPNDQAPATAFELAHAFHGPVWFARTTNGAAATPAWETARIIYDPGNKKTTFSNQIVVLPDGMLLDGFFLVEKGGRASIQVVRSADEGVTWSKRAIFVSGVGSVGEQDPEPINCRPFITGNPLCTSVRSDGVIIDLAVDYSTAHNGRVYVAWQDHVDNPFGDDAILLSYSDDGGTTWSDAQQVNQTPDGTFTDQALEPTVSVNDEGTVAVSYYDFRSDVSGDGELTTDHWIAHSHNGGVTWTEDHLAGPFDMHQAPYAGGYFLGDYQGLESQGAAFRPVYTVAMAGNDTTFPNANPTDLFTNTAS